MPESLNINFPLHSTAKMHNDSIKARTTLQRRSNTEACRETCSNLF